MISAVNNNNNTTFNGSARIIEYTSGCVKKSDYLIRGKGCQLLSYVTKGFIPTPSPEPKYLVKGQAEMLNKCIRYFTGHDLKMNLDGMIWLKNKGNNVFEYCQEGYPKSTCIKLNLNA